MLQSAVYGRPHENRTVSFIKIGFKDLDHLSSLGPKSSEVLLSGQTILLHDA